MQRVFFAALIILLALPLHSQQPNVSHNQAGRPGYFHFVTLEQAQREDAEIQRVNESLMRLGGQIATVADENARQQMTSELVSISAFVRNLEERRKPVGITAAEVEKQLTAAKGESHCATCHTGPTQRPESINNDR
jgi:hypothetical protein